jgi:DNA-binding transcriptional ArsR family regulator
MPLYCLSSIIVHSEQDRKQREFYFPLTTNVSFLYTRCVRKKLYIEIEISNESLGLGICRGEIVTLLEAKQKKSLVVEVDVIEAFEFLLTLDVFAHNNTDYEHDEVDVKWFEKIRKQVSPYLVEMMEQLHLRWGFSNVLLGLAYDADPPRDVPAFLAYFGAIDALDLRLQLLGYYQRSVHKLVPLDVIFQAAQGDQDAQKQYLIMLNDRDDDRKKYAEHLFTTDAQEIKELLINIFQQWYEQVFRGLEEEVRPILERDAAAKNAQKAAMTPERLVEYATNGVEYVAEPGIRKVVLAPSFIMRPWNEYTEHQDMKIFCYSVADESVGRDCSIPSARLVRLYKALADERRLRVLKLLTTRSYTLQEISDEFGVSKTTMHYHLATLRTAGLVLTQSDKNVYSLRKDMLPKVSELLQAYLGNY